MALRTCLENIIKKIIRDLFLLFGLITTAYYCRTLHSTSSDDHAHNSSGQPSLKLSTTPTCSSKLKSQKLQKPLQKTIELIEQMAVDTLDCSQQERIECFYQEALALQEAYHKTSPSLILLGPIGAAATVLKENKMCKELLGLLQEIIKYAEKNESSAVHDCYEVLCSLNNL